MVYVGLASKVKGQQPDPSLIDPSLAVKAGPANDQPPRYDYVSSYKTLSREQRAGYLAWLARGKKDPETPLIYYMLFLYGLERRVMVDLAAESAVEELTAIRGVLSELCDRLKTPYDGGFKHYAKALIDYIDLKRDLAAGVPLAPPKLERSHWEIPLRLRIELGRRVQKGEAISAELALAWGWYHHDFAPRTAASRYPDLVGRMFGIIFEQRYPKGFFAKPGKSRIHATYSCANPLLRYRPMQVSDLPDVFALRSPLARIYEVYELATQAIDPYSRWLSSRPGAEKTLQALALLPPELVDENESALKALREWHAGVLEGRSQTLVSGADLIRFWEGESRSALTKAASSGLLRLLEALGYGLVPDARFGAGPLAASGKYVLFKLPANEPNLLTSHYAMAEIVVQSAAYVVSAGEEQSHLAADRLGDYLETSIQLNPAEKARLHAYQMWVSAAGIGINGLKRKLDELKQPKRDAIGELLVSIAAADGAISPAEVTALTKVFTLLGMDAAEVTSRLHGALTSTRRAAKPETAQPERTVSSKKKGAKEAPSVSLDPELIKQKLRDTEHVGELLGTLFADQDEPVPAAKPKPKKETPAGPPPVRGLDNAHSLLLRTLADRGEWSRAEFAALAGKHRLLPSGAIDTLNETALDVADDYLIEGDDILIINGGVLEELLA
jgi:tellurite resistance protein